MSDIPTVFIVDDDPAIRTSLSLLMRAAGFRPVCFADGKTFLESEKSDGAACVLLDLDLPGLDGTEIQKEMQATGCFIPVIFLSGAADISTAVKAVQQGAFDFLEKPARVETKLLQCVRDAVKTHSDYILSRKEEMALEKAIARLSARELEVAKLAANGMANKVIGAELGISERTVEVHRGRAMKKLDLRTAAELILLRDKLNGHRSA